MADINLKNRSGTDVTYTGVKTIQVPKADGTKEDFINPQGNINITDTQITDVRGKATAQVVDENLKAENIAKDVTVLGITGTHEGGGGEFPQLHAPTISIDEDTLTITNPSNNGDFVTGYSIYIDGSLLSSATATTVDLSELVSSQGAYTIQVTCKGLNFTESELSNSATYRTTCTVHFYDGTEEMAESPVIARYGDTVGSCQLTKTGSVLENWYAELSHTTVVPLNTAITSDITLYGVFIENYSYISIDVPEGAKAYYQTFTLKGTISLDWGDGTVEEITANNTAVTKSHKYTTSGEKRISYRPLGSTKPSITFSSYKSGYKYRADILYDYSTIDSQFVTTNTTNKIREIKFTDDIDFNASAFNAMLGCGYLEKLELCSSFIFDVNWSNAIGVSDSIIVSENNTKYDSRNGCNALIETATNTLLKGTNNTIIPNDITTIGTNAFSSRKLIKEITIPASVISIKFGAFQQCVSLKKIHFKSSTPPTIENSNAFNELPSTCIICVPKGSLSAYTSASNYPSSETYTYIEE